MVNHEGGNTMTGTTAGPSIQKQSRRGTIGRKNSSGGEEITRPDVVRNALGEGEKLWHKKKAASDEFNEFVKKVAEDAGYNASAVRAHINAIAKGTYYQHKPHVSQQLELFEEAGPLCADCHESEELDRREHEHRLLQAIKKAGGMARFISLIADAFTVLELPEDGHPEYDAPPAALLAWHIQQATSLLRSQGYERAIGSREGEFYDRYWKPYDERAKGFRHFPAEAGE